VIGLLADVHTTGVNWESVGTIVGSVTAVLTLVGHWVNSRVEAHRKATSGQIQEIAKALTTRLDHFDNHLDAQDRGLQEVSVRVARLEGPMTSINHAVNGAEPGDPSIRQNVETLIDRRDLDPDLPEPQP
jgi:hypothetical protein